MNVFDSELERICSEYQKRIVKLNQTALIQDENFAKSALSFRRIIRHEVDDKVRHLEKARELKRDINELSAEITKSGNEKTDALEEMRRSKAAESELKQRLESSEDKISGLKFDVDTKIKEIDELRSMNQTLKKLVDDSGDLNTKFEAVTATVATLESQLKAESDKLNVETTNGDKLKKENHELDEKLETLKKEKDDAFKEKAELSDLYEDIKKREEITTKIRVSLEEANRKTLQELETKANDVKAMEEKLQSVQEKNKDLMKEKLAFDETMSVLKLDVDTKLKDIDDLRATNQTLNLKLADKMGELSDLSTKFEAVTATVATLKSQLKAESDRANVKTTNGDKLKKENHELVEKLETVKKEKEDAVIEQHNIKDRAGDIVLNLLSKTNDDKENIRRSLMNDNQKLREELEAKTNDVKAMEDKLQIVQEKNKDLMKEQLAFDETIENLEKSNAELKVTVNKLQSVNWNKLCKMQLESNKYLATITERFNKQIDEMNRAATKNDKTEEINTPKENRTYKRKQNVTFNPIVSTTSMSSPPQSADLLDLLDEECPEIPLKKISGVSCRTRKKKCYRNSRFNPLKKGETSEAENAGRSRDIFYYPDENKI